MHPITQWIRRVTNLKNFDVLAVCHQELEHGTEIQINISVYNFVESLRPAENRAIVRPQVIIMLEVFTDEMLRKLQRKLHSVFAQPANIHLICVGHSGIKEHFDALKSIWNLHRNINIYESPDFPFSNQEILDFYQNGGVEVTAKHTGFYGRDLWYKDIHSLSTKEIKDTHNANLKNHFILNCGRTEATYDVGYRKELLWLPFKEFNDYGIVDYQGKCCDISRLLESIELHRISKVQKEQYCQLYCTWVNMTALEARDRIDFGNRRLIDWWPVERDIMLTCFATIVREAHMMQSFNIISEKTFRPFLLHQMVIPTNYLAVEQLTDLGFKFPVDMFDYSYQNTQEFATRISLLLDAMREWISRNDIASLRDYYNKNIDMFLHNAELARSITHHKTSKPN
jgi:hypothetical protein